MAAGTEHVPTSFKVGVHGKEDHPRYRARCSCGGFTTYQSYSTPEIAEQAVTQVHINPHGQPERTNT